MSETLLKEHVVSFLANLRPPLWPADKLVVAVSGGPDSLALLHLLTQGGAHRAENVIAAHLDHGWREEAAIEAGWVAQTAVAWGATAVVERVDTAALAAREGLSLEEAGRLARYDFLARTAHQAGVSTIVTAHHADDQAETVLMHLLRGSGLAGLRGMLPVSAVPGEEDLRLIRPLLERTAAEIRAYCETHRLEPIEDPTNEETRFYRNRLRHELLPILETYNPRIRRRLQHTASVIAADYALLERQRQRHWDELLADSGPGWRRLDLAGWRALPLSLRRSTLRQAVTELAPAVRDISFRTIELARLVAETGEVGSQATLPGDLALQVEYGTLILVVPGATMPLEGPQLPGADRLPLPLPGEVVLDGWRLVARTAAVADPVDIVANPDPWRAFIDAGTLTRLAVRVRQPGDRMQPLGMDGRSAKIKDLMINRKLPAALRARWPLVVAEGQIVWLVGHVLDERWRVSRDAERVFELSLLREE